MASFSLIRDFGKAAVRLALEATILFFPLYAEEILNLL
jgi:hypothetical protein